MQRIDVPAQPPHSRNQPRADLPRSARPASWAAAATLLGLSILSVFVVGACLPSGTRGQGSRPGPANATGEPTGSVAARPSGPAPARTIVPPTPTPAPTFLVYTVKTGDRLDTIAHRFGTTARSIAFWNRSTYPSLDPDSAKYRPDLLKIGWALFLVPNDVVDEQDLPGASTDATSPSDASGAAPPTDGPNGGPLDSAAPSE